MTNNKLEAMKARGQPSFGDYTNIEWLEEFISYLDVHKDEGDVISFGFTRMTGDQTLYYSLQAAVDAARKVPEATIERNIYR